MRAFAYLRVWVILLIILPSLSGCILVGVGGTVAAKYYLDAKPKITYSIRPNGDIEIKADTYSNNRASVKETMMVAAGLVGEMRGCITVREISNTIGDGNLSALYIKANEKGVYACGSSSDRGIEVAKLRQQSSKVVNKIEANGLLKPAEGESKDIASYSNSESESNTKASEGSTKASSDGLVRSIQIALKDLGYSTGPVDGVMGPKTRDALKLYQQEYNLPVTGRIDKQTKESLIKL